MISNKTNCSSGRARPTKAIFAFALVLLAIACTPGQRLAIKSFRTADGLAHNNIKRIFQDSNGYLWIATWEGLSRYDGYEFKNYEVEDGLGGSFINDVTADRLGNFWVATNGGGLSRLIDEPPTGLGRSTAASKLWRL